MGETVVRRNKAEFALLAVLAGLALLVRYAGRWEFTPDMRIFYVWYGKLDAAGGFPGLKQEIGNYNAPFLYLLAALTYLPGAVILKIKATWLLFDALLVFFTFKITALRWPGWKVPALAAAVMAFLPTVVVNSSFYGQCDAIWGAFALGGLWLLLSGRDWWGVSLLTVALSVKPQAIFVFPLLLLLVLGGKVRWRALLAAPVVYVLLDLPAIFAGRNAWELLTLYSPSRQAQYVPALTSNAASLWAFVPVTTRLDTLKTLGYLFAAVLVIGVIYTLIAARAELNAERVVTAAAFFAVAVPFVLPGMHERYFYLADVLTLVLAVYRPRWWFVPLLVQLASLLSYLPFLFEKVPHGPLVPLKLLATMMFAAVLTTGYALIGDLRAGPRAAPPEPEIAPAEPEIAPAEPDIAPAEPEIAPAEPEIAPAERVEAEPPISRPEARPELLRAHQA
jgi:Gpi18-like mannosyltransferase